MHHTPRFYRVFAPVRAPKNCYLEIPPQEYPALPPKGRFIGIRTTKKPPANPAEGFPSFLVSGELLDTDFHGRVVDFVADYVCYKVPNEFIVGFGLDYAENYRNLPYVGVLKEDVYSK